MPLTILSFLAIPLISEIVTLGGLYKEAESPAQERQRDDVAGGGIGPGHKNIPQWIAGDVVHCGIFVFHDLAVGIR